VKSLKPRSGLWRRRRRRRRRALLSSRVASSFASSAGIPARALPPSATLWRSNLLLLQLCSGRVHVSRCSGCLALFVWGEGGGQSLLARTRASYLGCPSVGAALLGAMCEATRHQRQAGGAQGTASGAEFQSKTTCCRAGKGVFRTPGDLWGLAPPHTVCARGCARLREARRLLPEGAAGSEVNSTKESIRCKDHSVLVMMMMGFSSSSSLPHSNTLW